MKDGLAQLAQEIFRSSRKVRGQDFNGRLLFDYAQRLWILKHGFRFKPRHAQTHFYGPVSRLQHLRDFAEVVAMKEKEDEDAGCARRVFARALVMTNVTQLVLGVNQIARVGGFEGSQSSLSRFVFDDRELLQAAAGCLAHL